MKNIILKTIKNPRVTEKASNAFEKNVYVFNVADSANKKEIKKAIFSLYKVNPVKVNVLPVPYKNTFSKGKSGVKGGGKKAVVYLKEGDKIEIV
ncbi:MAG: 50S ribosomal protein L23 [Candidatus Paceibacterota bacterium]